MTRLLLLLLAAVAIALVLRPRRVFVPAELVREWDEDADGTPPFDPRTWPTLA
jgi:hypothetical protein